MGIAIPLTWGMGFVFAKAAIEHFPPIFLMSLRFAVTALALVWFVRVPLPHLRKVFGITLVAAAIQYSLTFTGLKSLDASIAILVVQLEVPFLALVGGIFLKESVSRRKWLGIAVAFVGIAIIGGTPRLVGAWIPMLLVVGGAFAWAVGQAMVRRVQGVDGWTMTAWVAVFAAPQLLVMSLIFESGHVRAVESANWIVWTTVVYLGLVMTAFGYGLWYTLVRRHPLSTVGPFLLLLPFFSVAAAAIFLGERLTWQATLGGLVLLAGVGVIVTEGRDILRKRRLAD
jgi:O-acetylserine/cysteine efflux transporter